MPFFQSARGLHYTRLLFRIVNNQFQRRYCSKMTDNLEAAKRLAAWAAVDTWITEETKVVGIGSGSTVIYAIERIAERALGNGPLSQIVCVPSSYQARLLILQNKLILGDLDRYPKIDVTIDGADEADKDLVLIKGGGGCMLQEKVLASCSKNFIIIADHTKNSERLGQQYCKGIPIEITPLGYVPIKQRIEDMYGGECVLRMAKVKSGPIVTDNGNFITDWRFVANRDYEWDAVGRNIKLIPGVMEVGLFVRMAKQAYFGMADGSVIVRKREPLPAECF